MNFASNFALCAILIGRGESKQLSQGRERFALLQVAIREAIEIDDVHTIIGRKLNQAQAAEIGIKLGRFSIETDGVLLRKLFNCQTEFRGVSDDLILRVHCQACGQSLALVLSSNQVRHRAFSGTEGRVHRVRGQEISVTGVQGVVFISNAQLQGAAKDPVRLVLVMRVRAVPGACLIEPLKDTVAFALKLFSQLGDIGWRRFVPSVYLQIHMFLNFLLGR